MKKIFLILAIAVAAISCSDDNDAASNKTLLKSAKIINATQQEFNYSFEYDNKQRISTMKLTGINNQNFDFTYFSDGRIQTITINETATEAATLVYEFTYDSKKKLNGFYRNEEFTEVIEETPNYYTYGNGSYFELNEFGDLIAYDGGHTMEYDTTKNGPMADVNTNCGMLSRFIGVNIRYLLTHKALTARKRSDLTLDDRLENIYNTEGYITSFEKYNIDNVKNMTGTFQYLTPEK